MAKTSGNYFAITQQNKPIRIQETLENILPIQINNTKSNFRSNMEKLIYLLKYKKMKKNTKNEKSHFILVQEKILVRAF